MGKERLRRPTWVAPFADVAGTSAPATEPSRTPVFVPLAEWMRSFETAGGVPRSPMEPVPGRPWERVLLATPHDAHIGRARDRVPLATPHDAHPGSARPAPRPMPPWLSGEPPLGAHPGSALPFGISNPPRLPLVGPPGPRRSAPPARRRGPRIVLGLAGGVLAVVLAALLVAWWYLLRVDRDLVPVSPTIATSLPTASFIFAADGTELARYGDENRVWVDLDEVSPAVIDALLATEDRRFFEHSGTNWRRVVAAGWHSLWGDPQGGSTLSMQLARNLFPEVSRHAPLARKAREIRMAARIERAFSKRQILELYLNRMSFGHGAYGIEAAARVYFSRSANRLEPHEAALLVGILKGPTLYDPYHAPERARERRDLVLVQMRATGRLSAADAAAYRERPLGLVPTPLPSLSPLAPHFAEHVRIQVEAWGRASGYDMYRDGLRVFTTLDPDLQRLAARTAETRGAELQSIADRDWGGGPEPFAAFWRANPVLETQLLRRSTRFAAVRKGGTGDAEAVLVLRSDPAFMDSLRADATRLETGLVVLDPHTGEVRAWVGSRDFSLDQYDKVASARRQPGSTFKPFLYAAALERGFSPYTLAQDEVRTYALATTGESWSPQNAGGGASGQVMTLRRALAGSRNTVAARLIEAVGPDRVVDTAHRMGIRSPLLAVPSLALGTSEVTLLELSSALGTLVSGGVHQEPLVISRIEDGDGRVLESFAPETARAISPGTAYTLVDMLRDVLRPGGTGFAVRGEFGLQGDFAAKTGTSQNNSDGWFVLLHPRYVIGAWVGFNQPAVRFRSDYWGQGGHNAARIVADFAVSAASDPRYGLQRGEFAVPDGYEPPAPPSDPYAGNLVDPERVRLGRGPDSAVPIDSTADTGRRIVW